MNPLWSYLWPALVIGLILGVVAGAFGFRLPRSTEPGAMPPELRRKRIVSLAVGAVLSLAATALWHGPFGAADRLSAHVERDLHGALVYYEMVQQVTAHLHHGPLTREVVLSGSGDDFQRSELARLLGQIPGVRSANWTGRGGLPLIVEGCAVSLLGFLLGLLLAYLVELRRRYNSQWNW